jgi:hypothetical protein
MTKVMTPALVNIVEMTGGLCERGGSGGFDGGS